ncbi:ephrin type-B receptor 3-like [Paramacrobiotus metropolitanus]|uniref:ephrin type-B receptor 3-like n=1 Tax=Paramacrobiotus metropolitanus TaxID=2943436 RepID=UPI00244630E5|nr:ephrin type-B receptor 3-like [Paramacrobiotus metropolitanus]
MAPIPVTTDASSISVFNNPGHLTLVSATAKDAETGTVTFSYSNQGVPDNLCTLIISLRPTSSGQRSGSVQYSVELHDVAVETNTIKKPMVITFSKSELLLGETYEVAVEGQDCNFNWERIPLGSSYLITIPTCLQTTNNNLMLCVPPAPTNIRWNLTLLDDVRCLSSAAIQWDRPAVLNNTEHDNSPHLPNFRYDVTWSKKFMFDMSLSDYSPLEGSLLNVTQEQTDVDALTSGTYDIKICARGPAGCSRSAESWITVSGCHNATHHSDNNNFVLPSVNTTMLSTTSAALPQSVSTYSGFYGIFGGLVGALLIAFVVLYMVIYRRKPFVCAKKHLAKCRTNKAAGQLLPLCRGFDNLLYLENAQNTFGVQNDIYLHTSKEDIPLESLQPRMIREIGTGEFGVVQEISIRLPSSDKETHVALKTMRNSMVESERNSLVQEIQTLRSVPTHKNVVAVVASLINNQQVYLLMELCCYDLRTLAKRRRFTYDNEFAVHREFLGYAIGAAEGMDHLYRYKIIHRDLAARNILVTADGVAKISDFGLSRTMQNRDYYRQISHGKVPWKWLAPESLESWCYSTWSDVWAFGITMWELFSFGDAPYRDISSIDILFHRLKNERYVMAKPQICPENVYEIMLACWNVDPKCRPGFAALLQRLSAVVECLPF